MLSAGVTAFSALSKLTRLVLEGDGFGIEELAMKVISETANYTA